MAERGYFIFYYRGKYYIFFQPWSYPAFLGKSIISQISRENVELWKTLLEQAEPYFGKIPELTKGKRSCFIELTRIEFLEEFRIAVNKNSPVPESQEATSSPEKFQIWIEEQRVNDSNWINLILLQETGDNLWMKMLDLAVNEDHINISYTLSLKYVGKNISEVRPHLDLWIEWV